MPDKATGHTYTEVVTEPTCTKKGFTTYTCDVCADKYDDNYTDPVGHKFGDYTVVKEATCVTPGEQTSRCTVCNAEDTQEIPVIAHVYEWKATTPATCLTAGEEKNICVCGKFIATRVVDALGHKMGEPEVVTAATCTKDGVSVQCCLNEGCKHQVKEAIKAAHVWTEEIVLTEPTCTKEGTTAGKACSMCGEVQEGCEMTLLADHELEKVETVKPTTTEKGYDVLKCKNCDYEEYDNYVDELEEEEEGEVEAPEAGENNFFAVVMMIVALGAAAVLFATKKRARR